MADRMRVGGTIESVQAQLELDVPLSEEKCIEVLGKLIENTSVILEQTFCLEQKLEAACASLAAEKRLSLDLQVENRDVKDRNVELAKQNRQLKGNIQEFFGK